MQEKTSENDEPTKQLKREQFQSHEKVTIRLEDEEKRSSNLESELSSIEGNSDAVFGKLSVENVQYKSLSVVGATIICLKIQLGLGILSIPSVLLTLGAVPGVIVILVIAAFTSWADYIMGATKRKHPEIGGISDWGLLVSPKYGNTIRDIIMILYIIFMVLIASASFISVSVALNVLSNHGACTVLFIAIAAIGAFLLGSIQTFSKISILGWAAIASIMISVLTLAIGLGVSGRPALVAATGTFDKQLRVISNPSFADAIAACGNVLFAYGGVSSFMNVAVEMKDPKLFTRAVLFSQAFVTVVYLSIGIAVYYMAGQFVSSPALSTAGPLISKIAYGLAIPGLMMSALIFTHIAAKTVFLRVLRDSIHLSKNTLQHWVIWISCTASSAICAFILAAAIPIFGSFIALVGALLASFFCFILPGFMWLFDNGIGGTKRNKFWAIITFLMIGIGFLLLGAGTWGAILGIETSLRKTTASFSCASNA